MSIFPYIKYLPGGKDEAWKAGFNGRHQWWGVKIFRDLQYMEAILAQEVYEWRFKMVIGALVGFCLTPLLILFLPDSIRWMIAPLVFVTALLLTVPIIPPLHRLMEIRGHMLEWAVAVGMGADPNIYFEQELTSLEGYDQFKGWSRERIRGAMLAHREWAMRKRRE